MAVFLDSVGKIESLKRRIQAHTLSNLCQLEQRDIRLSRK